MVKQQNGVGLIEVMVAVLVLSISLLAIASLQTRSLQYNQSAYWRSQANILAYDVMDRLRIERSEFDDGFQSGFGAVPGNEALAEWATTVSRVIPGGEGAIDCNRLTNPSIVLCSVSVRWVEANIFGEVAEADLDGEARTTFTYVSSI